MKKIFALLALALTSVDISANEKEWYNFSIQSNEDTQLYAIVMQYEDAPTIKFAINDSVCAVQKNITDRYVKSEPVMVNGTYVQFSENCSTGNIDYMVFKATTDAGRKHVINAFENSELVIFGNPDLEETVTFNTKGFTNWLALTEARANPL